ncbi:hypothetical protein GDO81_001640 [Engystomops pustulosus]|uniref:Beta-1,3-galactosyl-O-glycosyl-glycoprotein beta-1,6-N-acetylglucosaminyltransferase n=1 Tax=Engystomops pustulosus TaxID=76066 RepID=A0AAV7DGR1_ENGPU|nr:hypothetical protein GDO81_001640 [Engystomops pustulosus]KAG8595816.1 hypothetical protein GDO81_001640 [Engystomops pustulosus]KAG8595817.1 hypothetical protein GDO81_001640 [Engystomops pustulosus]
MLKRKLRYCKVSRIGMLLCIVLTAVTLTVVKNHNKTSYFTSGNLEIGEENPTSSVNCTKIIQDDLEAIQSAKLELLTVKHRRAPRLTENDYINMTKDCFSFTKNRKYVLYPITKEERDFPIAYSIVVHHKIDMLERLLRTIYMPHNYYCLHVDKKSSDSFVAAVKGIASCFENVFIASQLENVVYASWSRVQADLNCMTDLHHANAKWKYLINLCGMDFPIKTNREIVQMLKALKGENSLETEKMPAHKEVRWRKHYQVSANGIQKTELDKGPPPFEVQVFSGSAYFVLSRAFVKHVLENEKIQKFLEWSKDTYSPDEFLWATLQRLPEMPGSVPANSKYDVSDMNSIARTDASVLVFFFLIQQDRRICYRTCTEYRDPRLGSYFNSQFNFNSVGVVVQYIPDCFICVSI